MRGFFLGLLALLAGPALADSPLQAKIAALGGHPCAEGGQTCFSLDVPLDFAQAEGRRIAIDFAIDFADDESKGVFVIVVGGPGGSGLQSIASYVEDFGDRLDRNFDVVFFDQRGVGPDHGIECPKAQGVLGLAPGQHVAEMLPEIRKFVGDCVTESGKADLLPYLATDRAIRDLEAFRQAIGAPKIWLYGESYGTQFAQEYAAAYPDSLKGLILDGVVDLARDAKGYYDDDASTAEAILDRVFAACDSDSACHADMGGQPAAVRYDELAAKAASGAFLVDYPLADGTTTQRPLTPGLLQAAAFYGLYSPGARSEFLRVLAAAARGNLVPLLRLGYLDLGIDGETLVGFADESFYGAAYYAITCPDYDDAGAADVESRVTDILADLESVRAAAPRLGEFLYAERLTCAYWPVAGRKSRPQIAGALPFPVLLFNTDTDPATPLGNGYDLFARLEGDAYMVTLQNGPHVIAGRGRECPDALLFDLLLYDQRPAIRDQFCLGDLLDGYQALTLTSKDAAENPLALAIAIYDEYQILLDYAGETGIGCDFGGAIFFGEETTEFKSCRLWPDIAIDGTVESVDTDEFSLTIAGAHQGEIDFSFAEASETWSISGRYDGKPIPAPFLPPP